MDDQARVGEAGDVQRGGDLVCFGVLDRAGPEEDVVLRLLEEVDEVGCEQSLADEGRGVVVFGAQQDDEHVFELALCGVEGVGVAVLVEGEGAVGDAVFFFEFAVEARRGVSGVELSSAGVS